jgi:hypothetical protein
MIMMAILAVIEKAYLWNTKWREPLITGKRFAYPKRPFVT